MERTFPDWRSPDEYPRRFEDWDLLRWAWEFLRRNTEYRADFLRYSALPLYDEEGRKTGACSGEPAALNEPMAYRYSDPLALAGETVHEYIQRMEAAEVDYFECSLTDYLCDKWNLMWLPNPDDADAWEIISFFDDMPPYDGSTPAGEGQIALLFDLRFPIDRQIEEAKAQLLAELDSISRSVQGIQLVRAPKPRRDRFPEYLRAFDGYRAGATARQIAQVLFPSLPAELTRDPGITRAESAVKAGERLVQSGFRDLVRWLHGNHPP